EGTSKESSAEPRVKEETPDEADTRSTAAAEVGTVGPTATEPSQQGSALVEAAAEV
ncbi:hypothetical protein LTR53_018373, partial [Teratosphaeriaceae sp. CCFEE 6253]